ncbi:hypothetical protein K504DRAFT_28462 [Pleomassaria siparia CBS 279.74]|uniref:Uncharacterized protein n=1 Tax=Pleomassaria siparia CBS 279.74 TaxID=1314801 RepID=A0A6G1KRQ1_9PLEO|nr:hypothetical protein K504DRAFT_28462 [Pleomassaria siparia CBS 279.74]
MQFRFLISSKKPTHHHGTIRDIYVTLLFSLLLALSILLPYHVSRIPRPTHPNPSPGEIFPYIVVWTIAGTPSLFFVGGLACIGYHYREKKNDFRRRQEREVDRERILAVFKGGGEAEAEAEGEGSSGSSGSSPRSGLTTKHMTTSKGAAVQMPKRVSAWFPPVRERLREAARCRLQKFDDGKVDEDVLWDIDEYEMQQRRDDAIGEESWEDVELVEPREMV